MKITITILLFLQSSLLLAQGIKGYHTTITAMPQEFSWTYKDFSDNNITRIRVYAYDIKKDGNVSGKKSLIYQKQLNIQQRKALEIKSAQIGNGLEKKRILCPFTEYYSKDGKLVCKAKGNIIGSVLAGRPLYSKKPIKSSNSPNWPLSHLGSSIDSTIYYYNDDHTLSKTIQITSVPIFIENESAASQYNSTQATITEYVHNAKKQIVRQYTTRDSARTIITQKGKVVGIKTVCHDCTGQYLTVLNEYLNGRLITTIYYCDNGKIDRRARYWYNDQDKLVKNTDSSRNNNGINDQLTINSSIDYKYHDTTLIEKKSTYRDRIELEHLSLDGKINKRLLCTSQDTSAYNYTYKNNKLFSITNFNKTIKSEILFSYYPNGLLFEQRVITNKKTTNIYRYYYK